MAGSGTKGEAAAEPGMRASDPARQDAAVSLSPESGLLCVDLSDRSTIEAIALSAGHQRIGTIPPTLVDGGIRRFVFDLRTVPADLLLMPKFVLRGTRPDASDETVFSLDVDSRTFHPLSAVAPENGGLEGHVDGLAGGIIRGWAFDPSAPDRRVEIRLFVDGIFAGMAIASRMRPDLLATGRGDGCYGFEILADPFLARAGGDQATITVVAGSENKRLPASGSPTRRRRWSLKIPSRRRRPLNVREFVEMLAAVPPFPKRSYVIDPKTEGAMPDAFSADYLILALEHLRVDMVRTNAVKPRGLRERLFHWLRLRRTSAEIARLAALAKATAASQEMLKISSQSLEVPGSVPPR